MKKPSKEPGARRSRAASRGERVTLKQVADALILSPTTVSLVLNQSPAAASIPEETQERVFATAEKLGYRPDLLARSLRSRRSLSIGVLVPEISDAYASDVLSGVESRLLEEGYFYFIVSHHFRGKLLREHMQLLKDRMVEGFILIATELEESPGIPSVAIAGHQAHDQVTNLVVDHDRAAALALAHLAELGHERIAFFRGPAHSADSESRWRAILAAAGPLGLEVRPELTLQLGSDAVARRFSSQEAYEEGYAFGRKLLQAAIPFTALFAFNDVSAIGATRALLDAGLQVPEQVSVLGFDDIHPAAFQNPSLTTVRQPLAEMGKAASDLLLRRLSGEQPPEETITVEPELVVRDSTGPAHPGVARRPRRRHG